MKITSMDITNKQFKKSMRGYNCDEVDEFLDKISDDYEELYKNNSSLRERVNTLEERLNHYDKMEETIQNTLLLAQNAAEQAKETAQKEADLIIKNANDSAKRVIEKSQEDVMKINDEFQYTKQEFNKFRNRYKTFMKTQMDMFYEMEKEFMKNYNLGTGIEEKFVPEKEIEVQDSRALANEIDNSETREHSFKVSDITIDNSSLNKNNNEIKSFYIKED
ncbi:DivIVA domain-containing protein [Clostridium botulinum]|uniref:DivIVA domain-containing protein n=1 Tax=Clostridium botulinum TaxID=1491 RepID=UPI0001F851A6|nr:DivIVA domain-containing protein [Clostridium botulinum]KEI91788.1 cell division protein DivIVA [Clostridium botulinum B2 275]MBE1304845.1 DivIVA domain-containing protein [Clostridium botulinum]NFB16114.1 DivIVA domain-containing protein [Clostridium botulinum]NFB68484.1 DivIVA domain-containing protein [Clostridium botulinum]NFB97535.1 DivIVA domain-containing protein [Clostridium botulinum]